MSRPKTSEPVRCELKLEELKAILERAKPALSPQDHAQLCAAVDTLMFLTQELEAKGTTIGRLRRMLFGASTEKTKDVFPGAASSEEAAGAPDGAGAPQEKAQSDEPPGHGRNGACAYAGAERVKVAHPALKAGEQCPVCPKGKVYPLKEPAVLVRIRAMAPLQASLYELCRLRCNACGEVFTADSPQGVGPDKYDETAAAMIGLLRYGTGVPFNRIARLEKGFGIPLPPTTQWKVVESAAGLLSPAHEELCRQAAQGELLHNDDTRMKILSLSAEQREADEADGARKGGGRKGVFTSGIVAKVGERQVALFFTGRKHAGENLRDVLLRRAQELPRPIQMCDALAANMPSDLKTIVANCLAHGRRQFVDVADRFPEECRFVLEQLREVYKNDDIAREQKMSAEERLRFHREKSEPVMEGLKKWMEQELAERKVEPNSGLGEAMGYMRNHWHKLTLFLKEPGAPLDNSICERALKKAICHRKNSLFYKTQNGARVGDVYMSLIHTAELNDADPFDYLVALQRHADHVARAPAEWMPWNYKEAVARLPKSTGPPS